VRIASHGAVSARATAHGGYGSGWQPWRAWYWVHGGSHAGDIVGGGSGDRTTPASALELTPLERMAGLGSQRFAVDPPWLKAVYRNPESGTS